MRTVIMSLIVITGLIGGAPASAAILARCGASNGYAYYLDDPSGGWAKDQISKGDLIFTLDDGEKFNVIFRDASGNTIDAREDRAVITATRIEPDSREFSILVVYASTGVTESYNIVTGKMGAKKLLWTSSKSRVAGVITKVGAYVADCD